MRADAPAGDVLPEDLDVDAYVGPYQFPDIRRRRIAGTMYVEEILDGLQRQAMDDESVQPLVRQVSRIHVIEEARHISYAREETLRAQADSGWLKRTYNQFMIGLNGSYGFYTLSAGTVNVVGGGAATRFRLTRFAIRSNAR